MKFSLEQMETIRYQFDSFCRKVLRDYSRDLERQRKKRNDREVSLEVYMKGDFGFLSIVDDYPVEDTWFRVFGCEVAVKNERLAEAMSDLSEENRNIILLSYYLDMNDREIAELMNMIKRTVQRHRVGSVEKLKQRMEDGNVKKKKKKEK